jgi:small subunit ribosomal protein S7
MEAKILIFNRWDLTDVKVEDAGLVNYINLSPVVVPRTGGKHATVAFHKNKMNIVERFMNKMMVPGHRGKKHKITSGQCVGHTAGLYNDMKKALEIVEKRTNKNPVQVLVHAIENAALMEEVAAYRMGGIIARQAVVVAPQRRLDMALRHLTQGIFKNKHKNKTPLPDIIANEILAAYTADPKSFAIQERSRIEKEAEGAR